MAQKELCISILVVSGSTMAGDLYTQSLNRRAGFRVVAHTASVDEAVRVVGSTDVDIALVSTTLAGGPHSALATLPRIHAIRPNVKAIVLLQVTETDLIVSAFRAGARGVFFPSANGFKMLCRCVEKVHEGQVWANNFQLLQLLEAFAGQAPLRMLRPDGTHLLTKREEQVVRLVEDGFTNRQIANELHLSEHTVRNNLFRIYDKLGVSSRVELALYRANSSRRLAEEPRRDIRKPVVRAHEVNESESGNRRATSGRAISRVHETF